MPSATNCIFILIASLFFQNTLAENQLPAGPNNLISNIIKKQNLNKDKTYPVELKWKQVPGADEYKIIIIRKDKHFRKVYLSKTNSYQHKFVPFTDYSWEVVATKNGQDLTQFSAFYDLLLTDGKSGIKQEYQNNPLAWTKKTYQKDTKLPRGPGAKIAGTFTFREKKNLYPVNLIWEKVPQADTYEIEIIRVASKRRMFYYAKKNEFGVNLVPNAEYHWRVLAYKNNKKITNYSYPFLLKVIYKPQGDEYRQAQFDKKMKALDEFEEKYFKEIALNEKIRDEKAEKLKLADFGKQKLAELERIKQEDELIAKQLTDELKAKQLADRKFASEQLKKDQEELLRQQNEKYQREIQILKDKLKEENKTLDIEHWQPRWVRAGLGLRFTRYNQDINSETPAINSVDRLFHATNGDLNFKLSGGYFLKPKVALTGQLNFSNGAFLEVTDAILIDYTWTELHLDAVYLFDDDGHATKKDHWFARAGFLHQSLSLLTSFPGFTVDYEVVDSNHFFLTFGGGYNKKLSPHFKVKSHASALVQLFSNTSKFDYSPEFGLGINTHTYIDYLFNKEFHIGIDWQFQYINISYNIFNGSHKIDGQQDLVQNKLGLNLKYNF